MIRSAVQKRSSCLLERGFQETRKCVVGSFAGFSMQDRSSSKHRSNYQNMNVKTKKQKHFSYFFAIHDHFFVPMCDRFTTLISFTFRIKIGNASTVTGSPKSNNSIRSLKYVKRGTFWGNCRALLAKSKKAGKGPVDHISFFISVLETKVLLGFRTGKAKSFFFYFSKCFFFLSE